jgi:hypothetical protein
MTSGIKRADPFQDHEFRGWACCEEGRSTCYRRSHSRCTDLNRGCFGRYLQKNSTTRQIKFTRPLLKTENGVCAESRYREVGESQFRARFYACAYSHSLGDFVVHSCGARRAMSFQHSHILNHLRYASLLQLVCGNKALCANDAKRDNQSAPKDLHKTFFHIGGATVRRELR